MIPEGLYKNLKDLNRLKQKEIIDRMFNSLSREELLKMVNSTQDQATSSESKFHLYKPVSPIAMEFHKSKAMIRVLIGGNRSSKTVSATVDTLTMTTKEIPLSLRNVKYPPKEAVFVRVYAVDYPNGIEKIMIPKINEWAPPDSIYDYSAEIRIFTFRDGSKIELMTYEQDELKHGGTARHRIQFDEEPPEYIYEQSLMRIADYGGDIVFAMTPEQGMTWIYDRLYLRAKRIIYMIEDGDKRIVKEQTNEEGDEDIEIFTLATVDNKYLSKKGLEKIQTKIIDEDQRRIKLMGEIVSFSGLIYKSYSSKVHDVDPFHIPDLKDWERTQNTPNPIRPWPVYAALDPHPRTPHAYLLCAVDKHGRKFFFDEFFEELDINPLADRIKIIEQHYWMIWRLIDISANEDDIISHTNVVKELNSKGLSFQDAPKTLSSGIIRVKQALAFEEREGESGKVKMPEIFFFKTLKRTRWEIQRYVWDDWRRIRDKKDPKQKPKDKDDHMMENLYRIMLREPCWVDYEEINSELPEWRSNRI